jgi:hypothetical protein
MIALIEIMLIDADLVYPDVDVLFLKCISYDREELPEIVPERNEFLVNEDDMLWSHWLPSI